MQKRSIAIFFAVAFLFYATSGFASTIGVTGSGDILIPNATPNTGMTANFFNDPDTTAVIHAWNELQNLILGSNITLDFTLNGLHTGGDASENLVLLAGTAISSHYIYFDPTNVVTRTATFEYDADIIGVIVFSDLISGDRLLATDFLRNPLTVAGCPLYQSRLRGPGYGNHLSRPPALDVRYECIESGQSSTRHNTSQLGSRTGHYGSLGQRTSRDVRRPTPRQENVLTVAAVCDELARYSPPREDGRPRHQENAAKPPLKERTVWSLTPDLINVQFPILDSHPRRSSDSRAPLG
jgi:hypothetical protein